jgi:Tfp pilus assembly protein PilF
MTFFRGRSSALVLILVLAGCATQTATVPRPQQAVDPNAGKPLLLAGIKSYEDGEYGNAERYLMQALGAGLAAKADLIRAHKYLAFVYCVSNRAGLGEVEFGKVLALNPQFTLDPSEEGHPLWGPVFLRAKAKAAQIKKSA